MSLLGAIEETLAKGPQKASDLTPLEMVQFLEKKAGQLPKVLEHLQWVLQTVHQAHHTDQRGTWINCPKSVCESSARLLMEVLQK